MKSFDAIKFLEGLYQAEPVEPGDLSATVVVGIDDLPGDWRVEFEERAAFKEYHGDLPREHAEAEALKEIVEKMALEGAFNSPEVRTEH